MGKPINLAGLDEKIKKSTQDICSKTVFFSEKAFTVYSINDTKKEHGIVIDPSKFPKGNGNLYSYKTSTYYISVEFVESPSNKSTQPSAISVKLWDVTIKVEDISGEKEKSTEEKKEENEKKSYKYKCVSDNGLNFIANHEVDESTLILDKTGKILLVKTSINDTTIGYGYDLTRDPCGLKIKKAEKITPEYALELLKKVANKFASSINDSPLFQRDLSQEELEALVTLRYNVGSLGVVTGLIDNINNNSNYSIIKSIIDNHYNKLVIKNPSLNKYIKGWNKRTIETLNLYFKKDYGEINLYPLSRTNKKRLG